LASRCDAEIDAVELDKRSYEETSNNFISSPFFHRMNAIHSDFNEFAKNHQNSFDLIVSNPPFFEDSLKPVNEQKRTARHEDNLSFSQLCQGSSGLLSHNGILSVVIPYTERERFLKVAVKTKLFLHNELVIFPVRGHQPNRINLQLQLEDTTEITSQKFIIREEDGSFSQQYNQFFKDHYIGLKLIV
jgi:tRNA1Val (adenine37-N6)-methyltransferase